MNKVAVLISTKDRPDFMIRELEYYSRMKSPHPIYIADSSNEQNAGILKNHISKLGDKITVKYTWFPPGPDNTRALLDQVKEKYACFAGDDDYQIPNSLTKCADFLDNNPDYNAVSGYSVSFRLRDGGAYGKLERLADYPRHSIESETSRQRVSDFMKNIYSIIFFVQRVDSLKSSLRPKMDMANTLNELVYWNLCIIAGKSKVIDCLSLVRQIHNKQYAIPNSFDWITSKNFFNDYIFLKENISRAIADKDSIDLNDAEDTVREGFWHYIQKMLSIDYQYYFSNTQNNKQVSLRVILSKSFPVLKKIYRMIKGPTSNRSQQLHYEVLQLNSEFYKDFKPVMDSFLPTL